MIFRLNFLKSRDWKDWRSLSELFQNRGKGNKLWLEKLWMNKLCWKNLLLLKKLCLNKLLLKKTIFEQPMFKQTMIKQNMKTQANLNLTKYVQSFKSRSQYSFLESAFDPCNKENLLVTGQLPGWEEGLIKRLCVVYDPHNILPAMFRRKEFQLHYIELIEDLVSFLSTLCDHS